MVRCWRCELKLTNVEKLLVCSPLRACTLRKIEAPRVLSNLGIGERSVCLDVGCGSGVGALLINQYLNCEQVVGIDVDPGMVTTAQKRIAHPPKWAQDIRTDNIEFLCQDATRLIFPDRHFDAVFLFGVLHHIREWKEVILEVYRVLKGGGVFSFMEGLMPDFLSPACRLVGAVPISGGELKDALKKIGFSVTSFKAKGLLSASVCFVKATKEFVENKNYG